MKLAAKFTRKDATQNGTPYTYIFIHVAVEGVDKGEVSPILFISGPTSHIGHLNPDTNSFEEYYTAIHTR